jgi:nitrate/nitrite transporter NarK
VVAGCVAGFLSFAGALNAMLPKDTLTAVIKAKRVIFLICNMLYVCFLQALLGLL